MTGDAATRHPGPCPVCGADEEVELNVSPLDAPATTAWCDRCRAAKALPTYFVEARIGVGRVPRREMEWWADAIEREGWTTYVDGRYVPVREYLTPERLDEFAVAPPPPPRRHIPFPVGLFSHAGRPIEPGDPVRVFVDADRGRRPPGDEWIQVSTAETAISLLSLIEVESLSLAQHLGEAGRGGFEVVEELDRLLRAGQDRWPTGSICLHSGDAQAIERIGGIIEAGRGMRRDPGAPHPTWRRA